MEKKVEEHWFKPLWFCIRSKAKLCLAAFPSSTD